MTKIVLFFLFFASGCTPRPPDVFVFEHMPQRLSVDSKTGHTLLTPSPTCMRQIGEPECGHGVAIMSGREIFVGEKTNHLFNKKPWSLLRQQSIYLPAQESYAPLSAYIIDSCDKMGCSDDVDKFRVKLSGLGGIK